MAESFDVFLSHNSRDKPAVREVAVALQGRGLKVWLDEWELVPGRPWQEALEEIIETTLSSAVLVGKDGIGPWEGAEMRGCLAEFVARRLPVIPVLLPGAPKEPRLPLFLRQLTWVDLRGGLTEEGLDRLQWGITGKKPGRSGPPAPPAPPSSSEPPAGEGFTPSDLGRFVGAYLFTGLDATTGQPLYPPASAGEMETLAREARPEAVVAFGQEGLTRSATTRSRGGFDVRDLASTGWGVVFPERTRPEVREALAPLLRLRQQQAGRRFREFADARGYRDGETERRFLARQGVGPGAADPDRCPFYLLLVGGPEEVPWAFQHQLDIQYAVGRLSFDTPEEYARYAETVVAAETGRITRPRRLTLFGPRHPGDPATDMTVERLLSPLAASLARSCFVERVLADEATKKRLLHLLGDEAPALLFTAAHGLSFPAGHPRQLDHQGALVCQDWPGPRQQGPISPEVYLSGDDVDSARPAGLIAFLYGDHSLGTPEQDADRRPLAPHPFVASLPRRLLGHPAGGALAVIGHVERLWPGLWETAGGPQAPVVFEESLKRLFAGEPVGAALQTFSHRAAELAADLASLQEAEQLGKSTDPQELVRLWTAYNEARAFALLGDPAVRLPLLEKP